MRNRYALLVGVLLLVPILVLSNQGLSALSFGSVTTESVDALAESWSASPPTGAVDPSTEADVLDALQSTLQQIYDDVNPSVVNIQVVQEQALPNPGLPENPESPFEPSIPDAFPSLQGVGSGFIWDSQGHIVTNNHVVEGAESISVTFFDDTTVSAELVGADPHSDLAVVKADVPAASLQPVEMA